MTWLSVRVLVTVLARRVLASSESGEAVEMTLGAAMASASKGVEKVSWPLNETWSAAAMRRNEVTPVSTVPASHAKLSSRPWGSAPSEDFTVRAGESSKPVALKRAA